MKEISRRSDNVELSSLFLKYGNDLHLLYYLKIQKSSLISLVNTFTMKNVKPIRCITKKGNKREMKFSQKKKKIEK